MDTHIYETVETTISNLVPHDIFKSFLPYAFGASATIAGVFINKIFNSDDDIVEFHQRLDQQQYLQEIKELFSKKDHFVDLAQKSFLMLIVFLCLGFGTLTYLFVKLRITNTQLNILKDDYNVRLKNTENVIESILKDSEILDTEQLEFFKSEIEQQQTLFQNLIHNKSLELETKIADAKTTCLKTKKAVHDDYLKVKELTTNSADLKEELETTRTIVANTKSEAETIKNSMDLVSDQLRQKLEKISAKLTFKANQLNSLAEENKVDLFKCNSMLLNSQLLLEASILKFETLESIQDVPAASSALDRITSCLNKAKNFQNYLNKEDDINELPIEFPFPLGEEEMDTNANATNSALYEILQRMRHIEENLASHDHKITKNSDGIKIVHSNTEEQISNLKSYSEEWITSWVSVIYGLFNSSFLQLENQLFGVDCLQYETLLQEEDKKDETTGRLFDEIMSQCKQTCLKTIKEVNLLIFEYYLIQKSYASSKSTLVNMCNVKIDDELINLFEFLNQLVRDSKLTLSTQDNIINTLLKLKYDLANDLKADTEKFNTLVKQNLDDFYIIHDTMKTLFASEQNNVNMKMYQEDDSVIELSDNSFSLISSGNDKSYSESDSSLLETSISDNQLKPLKLADSSATKRKRLSLQSI